jgi:hypothetical protein
MAIALICPQCGAPLPLAATTALTARCEYCGATVRMAGGTLELSARSTTLPQDADLERRRRAFLEALKVVHLKNADVYLVLADAARAHLGPWGETDAVARVTLGLAAAFERESGVSVRRDPAALGRLAESYLRASAELRSTDQTTLNLPFLAATESGPKHFLRTVTVRDLARLAEEDSSATISEPSGPSGPSGSSPKKKRWWPF